MLRWVPAVKNGMGLRIIRRPQPHVTDFLSSTERAGRGVTPRHAPDRTGRDGSPRRAARRRRAPPRYLSAPPPGLGLPSASRGCGHHTPIALSSL